MVQFRMAKNLKTGNMKKFREGEDHILAAVLSIQWCYVLPETNNVDILIEE